MGRFRGFAAGSGAAIVVAASLARAGISVLPTQEVRVSGTGLGPVVVQVGFEVSANQDRVRVQVMATDLRLRGAPVGSHRLPLSLDEGVDVRVMPNERGLSGTAIGGPLVLAWQEGGCPPAPDAPECGAGEDWRCTEARVLESSDAWRFSHEVGLTVVYEYADPLLPQGDYEGCVRLVVTGPE